MLSRIHLACFSFLALLLLAPSVEAQFRHDHHPPYVDPHFDLRHRPQYDYGARPTSGNYYGHSATSSGNGFTSNGTCNGDGICNGNGDANGVRGSRSPKCPPNDNANLQLYVEDGLQVEINDQRTKPQTLAGVHRNSRIFLLEGLDPNQLSPCKIVIFDCDNHSIEPVQYEHTLWVRAGQRYTVRYRNGAFQDDSPPPPVAESIIPAAAIYESQSPMEGFVSPGAPRFEPYTTPADMTISPDVQIETTPGSHFSEIVPLGIHPIAQ